MGSMWEVVWCRFTRQARCRRPQAPAGECHAACTQRPGAACPPAMGMKRHVFSMAIVGGSNLSVKSVMVCREFGAGWQGGDVRGVCRVGLGSGVGVNVPPALLPCSARASAAPNNLSTHPLLTELTVSTRNDTMLPSALGASARYSGILATTCR